jgi:hypothetical protein
MAEVVVKGGKLVLQPGPGWQWFGWDGKVEIVAQGTPHPFTVDGAPVILAADVMALAAKVIGKQYKATGFDDVPGVATTALILVDQGTLSKNSQMTSQKVVLATTKGDFQVVCVPSMKAAAPPIPDPVPMKSGTWKIESAGQSKATSA